MFPDFCLELGPLLKGSFYAVHYLFGFNINPEVLSELLEFMQQVSNLFSSLTRLSFRE